VGARAAPVYGLRGGGLRRSEGGSVPSTIWDWLGRLGRASPPRDASSDLRTPAAETGSAPGTPHALILESLPDPVILVAAAGDAESISGPRVLFGNAAARELLRLTRAGGLLAAHVRNPRVLEALDEALYGRVEAEAEFEGGGPLERSWRAVARPLPSRDGRRLALLWMRDETDVRRNERMRADFLANASHELRTPLASLTGFIETLRGHAKDDPAARERFLGIMADQADRMGRLIGDLLSLSRIELSEHIAPSDPADLAMAATDVVDALGPIAKEREITLVARMPGPGEAVVTGDRDQIIQVIQNLADNAIKYAGKRGTVTVEITAGLSAEAAAESRDPAAARLSLLSPDHGRGIVYAAVRVADDGPGIAREYLPRLSERFYRVEGQKSGDKSGTGLGLAIVKHIVNRHRGGLFVESAEGKGAAFTAYFPMAPTPAAGPTPPAPGAVAEAPGGL